MESIDIKRQAKSAWEEICLKVNKAVVFVDNACAQSLHWNGGAILLFNAGAVNVKEFSSFEVSFEAPSEILSSHVNTLFILVLSCIIFDRPPRGVSRRSGSARIKAQWGWG